ncbi:hypothetical protein ACHMW6_15485 [Pseudoduganella sp. UC29_106]|uniref:hypothetical protein n=1 Tax=Pseudoduganella sp. UC29_106 TaxID=3374553 RepID=UPI00375644AB
MSPEDQKFVADVVFGCCKGVMEQVHKLAIKRTEALEVRVAELEKRLHSLDGQKAHLGNPRHTYMTKDM